MSKPNVFYLGLVILAINVFAALGFGLYQITLSFGVIGLMLFLWVTTTIAGLGLTIWGLVAKD